MTVLIFLSLSNENAADKHRKEFWSGQEAVDKGCHEKNPRHGAFEINMSDDRILTSGHFVPKKARYRAALHPEKYFRG